MRVTGTQTAAPSRARLSLDGGRPQSLAEGTDGGGGGGWSCSQRTRCLCCPSTPTPRASCVCPEGFLFLIGVPCRGELSTEALSPPCPAAFLASAFLPVPRRSSR